MRVLAKVLLGCSIFLWQHCVLTTFFATRSRAGLVECIREDGVGGGHPQGHHEEMLVVEEPPPRERGLSMGSPSPEGAEPLESPAPSGEGEESEDDTPSSSPSPSPEVTTPTASSSNSNSPRLTAQVAAAREAAAKRRSLKFQEPDRYAAVRIVNVEGEILIDELLVDRWEATVKDVQTAVSRTVRATEELLLTTLEEDPDSPRQPLDAWYLELHESGADPSVEPPGPDSFLPAAGVHPFPYSGFATGTPAGGASTSPAPSRDALEGTTGFFLAARASVLQLRKAAGLVRGRPPANWRRGVAAGFGGQMFGSSCGSRCEKLVSDYLAPGGPDVKMADYLQVRSLWGDLSTATRHNRILGFSSCPGSGYK